MLLIFDGIGVRESKKPVSFPKWNLGCILGPRWVSQLEPSYIWPQVPHGSKNGKPMLGYTKALHVPNIGVKWTLNGHKVGSL